MQIIRGMYSVFLSRWLRAVPRRNILVVRSDQLMQDEIKVMYQVLPPMLFPLRISSSFCIYSLANTHSRYLYCISIDWCQIVHLTFITPYLDHPLLRSSRFGSSLWWRNCKR